MLEGPRKRGALPPARVRISVGQDDLALRRTICYDKDGKKTGEVQFTNVKVNQPIEPSLFKYTPPEGAKVEDQPKPREEPGK